MGIETNGAGETVKRGDYITVTWQKGLPTDVGVNGCRVDDVLALASEKLRSYQVGSLACEENADALRAIEEALQAMDARRRRRVEQGVLNTMKAHETVRTEDTDHDFSATGA